MTSTKPAKRLSLLVEMIAESLDDMGMTDATLEKSLRLKEGAMVSIRAGSKRFPFSKIRKLSVVTHFSESLYLQAAIKDFDPQLWKAIDQAWSPVDLTDNERNWLKTLRRLSAETFFVPLVVKGEIVAMIAG